MPISKDQQTYCQLAQLSHAFSIGRHEILMLEHLLQMDNVNFKVLSNKSSGGCLIGATPLHIVCHRKIIKARGALSSDFFPEKSAKVLDALLERGADFTAKNKNGETVLHRAFYDMFLQYYSDNEETVGNLENALVQSVLKAHVDSRNTENPYSSGGLSHFHIACASNHLEAVRLFLNSGVSLNEAVNKDSPIFAEYTPLHFSVRFCGYETAKLLLEKGADVNAKNAKGLNPLHVVIRRHLRLNQMKDGKSIKDVKRLNKYTEEIEKIIRLFLEDSRVMTVDEIGFSKFHAACTLNDYSLAERFLRDVDVNCAINVDSPEWPGYTALHFAVRFNIEIVKFLLQNGANIEAEDSYGVTTFDVCMRKYEAEDLYDILSAISAFKEMLFSDGQTKLSDFVYAVRSLATLRVFLESKPKNMHLSMNWPGYYLSHFAVLFSQPDPDHIHFPKVARFCVMETYLHFDVNISIQDAYGRTPLHLAFYRQKEKIVDMFFRNQLGLTDVVDNNGLSHLHIACRRGNESAVRALLSVGTDVNRVYKGKTLTSRLIRGSTPLHFAVANRSIKIIKLLLEHGADANLIDDKDMTPMHRFTHVPPYFDNRTAIEEVGNLLLSSCESKNICDKNGLSHLHFASFTSNSAAVERLLKFGADPNIVFSCKENSRLSYCSMSCVSGYTPLHFAVENKDMKSIELLLRGGADILHKKSNGLTLFYDLLSPSENRIFRFKRIDISITKLFASIFANDVALRKRAHEDCGLTLLHIVCFLHDRDQIKRLLTDSRVDVNAQMHSNSPIWPGSTPLHILIQSSHNTKYLKETAKKLLDSGANVMLANSEGQTSMHKSWSKRNNNHAYRLLHLLLRYQTDYSINPVNDEGISHFHLACILGEYTIVEKFLENGVDANLPINYLEQSMTFQTPLRFMLQSKEPSRIIEVRSYLKTMDVLLKYGADINVQDEYGSNLFLEVAHFDSSRQIFLKKIHTAGADISCINIFGRSALEVLFGSRNSITSEELQIFMCNRNLFNAFNPLNKIGIISRMIESNQRKSVLDKIMENSSLFTVDQMGRTPIHNLVANYKSAISTVKYAYYIDKFIKMGFNIDAQDITGETALHMAAHFHNETAICGLLLAGADMNIIDKSNRTSLTKLFKFRAQWYPPVIITNDDNRRLTKKIVQHIATMQLCGLEVSSDNLQLAGHKLSKWNVAFNPEPIVKELKDTNLVKIGTGSLTLRNFLSETGAVTSRPSMTYDDREAVDKFFTSFDKKQFPKLWGLIMLQYRKMLYRLPLMESATESLKEILGSVNGFSMPDLCCRIILRYLTNTDIKHLIISMSIN